MATNTFERELRIKDPESVKKLMEVIATDNQDKPLLEHPYSEKDRSRGKELLKRYLSQSKR